MATIEKPGGTANSKWVYILKGVLLIVIGIWMLSMPKESFASVNFLIGLIIIIGGALELGFSIYYRKGITGYGWHLMSGLLDVILGLFIISNPKIILILITLLVSFWLILRGVVAINSAITMKPLGGNRWKWQMAFGILFILAAILLIWHPQVVGLTIIFWMAMAFIMLGILRLVMGFRSA